MDFSLLEIAQPECRLPVVNNPTVFLPERRLVAAANFSDKGRDGRLFLVDVDTLESRYLKIPDGQVGPYGFVRGADGHLYIGFYGARIYRFDTEKETFTCVADPFPDSNKLTWGALGTRSGPIYMGVYPTGSFTELQIGTGEARSFHPLGEDIWGVYARDFVELPDGRILLVLMGAVPTLFIFNPKTAGFDLRMDVPDGKQISAPGSLLVLDEAHVIYGTAEGLAVFNFVEGQWENDLVSGLPGPMRWLSRHDGRLIGALLDGNLAVISNGKRTSWDIGFKNGNVLAGGVHEIDPGVFIALGDNGQVVKFDLSRGFIAGDQLANSTNRGMDIHLLRKDPRSRRIVGSHFINSQIFQLDMDSGKSQSSLHKVVTTPGQITCATFLDDTAYLGIYGKAIVQSYDMDRPILFGENPREFCRVGESQNRPVGMCNDGEKIHMATRAGYTQLGGAISVIDPQTGQCEVYRDFVPHQNPVTLWNVGDGRLLGTTEIHGDQGSATPIAKQAVIYVWDRKTRSTIHTCVPWDTASLVANDLSPSGLLIGFASQRYFLFDARTLECRVHHCRLEGPVSGLFLDDQYFLAATGGEAPGWSYLTILDVRSNEMIEVGKVESVRLFQNLEDGEILVSIGGCRVGKLKLEWPLA